ncbi:MAG: class I SAM-dependent methyltransferase [Patescibacteria group bacterium]|jgi:SAM-dependent methyltransferase
MNKNACYLCGSKQLKLVVDLDWPIKKCLHCNLVQVNPLPSKTEVNALYQGDYWKNFSFYSSQIPAHEKYFNKKISDIKKLLKSGRLLDVGCAYGSLLKAANRQGYISEGIDISSFPVEQCRKVGLKAETGVITDIRKKNYYDIITAFEVVEHEREPLLTIKAANQLLKTNGLLVVSVPDSNSLSSKIMGKNWFGYRHKEHLFHFTKDTLNVLLRKGGFSNILIKKDIARPYLFVYYLERINFYLFKSKQLSKFILSLKKIPLINNLTVPINLWGNIIAYATKKDI